jgi:hypothetical protein
MNSLRLAGFGAILTLLTAVVGCGADGRAGSGTDDVVGGSPPAGGSYDGKTPKPETRAPAAETIEALVAAGLTKEKLAELRSTSTPLVVAFNPGAIPRVGIVAPGTTDDQSITQLNANLAEPIKGKTLPLTTVPTFDCAEEVWLTSSGEPLPSGDIYIRAIDGATFNHFSKLALDVGTALSEDLTEDSNRAREIEKKITHGVFVPSLSITLYFGLVEEGGKKVWRFHAADVVTPCDA